MSGDMRCAMSPATPVALHPPPHARFASRGAGVLLSPLPGLRKKCAGIDRLLRRSSPASRGPFRVLRRAILFPQAQTLIFPCAVAPWSAALCAALTYELV
jgi:hypothetical protein